MPTLHVVDRDGREHALAATVGGTLMQALRSERALNLAAICGGSLSCATCHVRIEADWLEKLRAPSADERELLGVLAHQASGSRLSCQIILDDSLDGLRLNIAPEEW
jgi:2Fe-2S ferredoxin